jgi:hypothetical protein
MLGDRHKPRVEDRRKNRRPAILEQQDDRVNPYL